MKTGRFRPTVASCYPDQGIFGGVFCILDEHIEVAVIVEDTGVKQLVLHLFTRPALVRLHQVLIGILLVGIFIEELHVGVGGGRVEVEVVFLHILAVIPLAVGDPKQALFEDWVVPVP
jgi:hypothetical protein